MDLFAEWRAAGDRGEFDRTYLAPAAIFETWIETCGFDPSPLTPEKFETFMSYLAGLGYAAQRLRQMEIVFRGLYLWGLLRTSANLFRGSGTKVREARPSFQYLEDC